MINLIIGCDWQGLYINNDLICEDHILDMYNTLKSISNYVKNKDIDIGEEFFNINQYYINDDWLEDRGCFPEKFEKIPKSMLYN